MDQLYIILSGLVTGVAGWFVGRRKSAAETDNIVLKNLEQSVGLYKLIIDNLRDEIQGLHLKMDEMETKIDELTRENKKLRDLLNK